MENAFIQKMDKDHGIGIMRKLMSFKMPCIVFCRNIEVSEEFRKIGVECGVPILRTAKSTSSFMAEVIRWLGAWEILMPERSISGVQFSSSIFSTSFFKLTVYIAISSIFWI